MNRIAPLRKKGHRITSQRENIAGIIKSTPQTAEQIYQALEKKVNLASIYRSLELFVDNGIARELDFGDGKKRYELSESDNHHHHLICDSCGKIEDIRMQEKIILDNVRQTSSFKVKKHKLEFFGLCRNCQ